MRWGHARVWNGVYVNVQFKCVRLCDVFGMWFWKNSLEMRHFNHLNGWLIVASLASECKASAWKTQKTWRERERECECEGDEVMMGGRRRCLSLHLWREQFISFHFSARVSWFHLFRRSGMSRLPTTSSHHLRWSLLFIHNFFLVKQTLCRASRCPFKQNKNALQLCAITFAKGSADLILQRTLRKAGLFKMYKS